MWGMSRGETIFCAIVITLIFGWAWLPRLGQRLGASLDKK